MLILIDTEVTNTMSTVYTTLDYEYWHENKGTGLALVFRKFGMYKWDQKSYKQRWRKEVLFGGANINCCARSARKIFRDTPI